MKILFIGAVKFSELALKKLVEINSNVVGVCTLEHSLFNADHVDLSFFSRSIGIPARYSPDINSEETIDWIRDLAPDIIFCFGCLNYLLDQTLTFNFLSWFYKYMVTRDFMNWRFCV